MNIKQYITFSFLFAPFFFLYGQTKRDTLSFRVVSYNVENLFDCRHDTLKNDYEFLPDAMRHWNYTKYKKKLDAIARTITAVGGWTPPALVALCESKQWPSPLYKGRSYVSTNLNPHKSPDNAVSLSETPCSKILQHRWR